MVPQGRKSREDWSPLVDFEIQWEALLGETTGTVRGFVHPSRTILHRIRRIPPPISLSSKEGVL